MWHWRINDFEAGRPLLDGRWPLRVPAAPRLSAATAPQGAHLLRRHPACRPGHRQQRPADHGPPQHPPCGAGRSLGGVPPQELLFEDRIRAGDLQAGRPGHASVRRARRRQPGGAGGALRRPASRRHRVAAVHRLDIGTSGPVLFGKGHWATGQYGRLLMDGQISKHYLALVGGSVPARGELATPVPEGELHEAGARPATAAWRPPAALALLELDLVTGRPHQARRQLADAGWPIVGDRRYGGAAWPRLDHPLSALPPAAISLPGRRATPPGDQPAACTICPADLPTSACRFRWSTVPSQGNFCVSNGEERV